MISDFTLKLIKWNDSHNNREMPWKGETDPYRIWLSEVILQQTRVEQGRAYYERFIEAYPTIETLAAAPDQTVFKLWEGLGYYSRCRNLLATARTIATSYRGVFPSTYHDILQLKGIGPYTAAAIASFAFGEKRAVLDGNVQRVIARYFGISTPVDTTEGKKLYAMMAQALIDEDSPGTYNQAIMDFGATICKPKNPLCETCVQQADCEAFKHKMTTRLPVKSKTVKVRNRWFYYFIIECGNSIYIRKRETKDIWQNLYEFVLLEKDEPDEEPAKDFLYQLLQSHNYSIRFTSETITQQLTHQRISGRFFRVVVDVKEIEGYTLVSKSGLGDYAFPKFINNFLEKNLTLKGQKTGDDY